jgi:hypothetical protein
MMAESGYGTLVYQKSETLFDSFLLERNFFDFSGKNRYNNMMNIFSRIYWFFSLYTDPTEKKMAKFLAEVDRAGSARLLGQKLIQLLQQDMIRFNLYQEWKFKGYKHLKKSKRKKLYRNADKLKGAFLNFYEQHKEKILVSPSLAATQHSVEKQKYVACMMYFLSPNHHYEYLESAAFSRLLRDPNKEKLIGDCNQICTLYLAVYSWKFPLADWNIKLLPGHVCLHWGGIDIECTNATVHNYEEKKVQPVQEMITTNILDVSEAKQKKFLISPKNFALGAKFVHQISSNRDIAEKNLKAAYHNLAIEELNHNSFKNAAHYFHLARENDQIENVWRQAVQYYLDKKNFSTALRFAKQSSDRELAKIVLKNQGYELLKKKNYRAALSKFRAIHDRDGQKAVQQQELYDLNQQLKRCKTIADFKSKKSTLTKMRKLAYEIPNHDVLKFCDDVLRQIK